MSQKPPDHAWQAIGLMLLAVFLFAIMDVAMKILAGRYPAMQVTFLRCAGSMPIFLLVIGISRDWRHLKTAYPMLQLLRAALGILLLTTAVICFRELPLADAYAIFFAAPLVIALLSGPLLGEPAGRHRTLAAILGFIGVVVILQPQGSLLKPSWGALMGLVAMVTYSITTLMMRHLGRRDSALTIALYFTALASLGSGLLVWHQWVPLQPSDWPMIITLVLCGTAGQLLITAAFRRGTPSMLAPFDYTSMIWALLFGYVLWGHLPGALTVIGSLIIMASGLYIIWREHRRAQLAGTQTPEPGREA